MRKYDVFEDRAVASERLCLGGTSRAFDACFVAVLHGSEGVVLENVVFSCVFARAPHVFACFFAVFAY